MGSFDVACALTGTPIFPGDPCTMVIFEKDYDPFGRLEWDVEYDVEKIVKSKYYDYGSIEPTEDATDEYLQSVTNSREDREEDEGRYHIFICKMAWDFAVVTYPVRPREAEYKMYERLVKLGTYSEEELALFRPPSPLELEMKSVFIAFRYACKNPLAGYWATGQWYKETIPTLIEHLVMTENRIFQILMDHPYLMHDKYDEHGDALPVTEAEVLARIGKWKYQSRKRLLPDDPNFVPPAESSEKCTEEQLAEFKSILASFKQKK